MQHQFENSAIVGNYELDGMPMEVCAEVITDYDPTCGTLALKLNSYLRHADPLLGSHRIATPWLPPAQSFEEHVSREEANDLTREISRGWRKKVLSHIPDRRVNGGSGPLLLCMM